jgi:tetratricopeptide (TPR) repeat protein
MTVTITRKTRRAIIDMLAPLMTTERRETLVRGAFWGDSILERVDWDGDETTFAANLINTALMDGPLDDGESPLVALLEEVQLHLPPEQREQVDAILGDVASDDEPPEQPQQSPEPDSLHESSSDVTVVDIEPPPPTESPDDDTPSEDEAAGDDPDVEREADPIDTFESAEEKVRAKDYNGAIADYETAIKQGRSVASAHYNIGRLKEIQKDYDAALHHYDESIKVDPVPSTYTRRGVVHALLGHRDPAFSDFASATSPTVNEPDPSAYFYRAMLYFDEGRYDDALLDLNRVIRLEPSNSSAYRERGVVQSLMKRHADAVEDYTAALRINSLDAEALVYRGNAFVELKNELRAIEDYSRALDIDDSKADTFYRRGKAYFAQEDWEAVIPDMRQAIALDNSISDAHFLLALCLMQAHDDYDEAIIHLERAQRLDPKNKDISAGLKIAREKRDG